jgi:hypothetical protein
MEGVNPSAASRRDGVTPRGIARTGQRVAEATGLSRESLYRSGHGDGRRTIDQQAGLGADLQQVRIVIRDEFRPALEVGFAAEQVTLA